MAVRAGAWPISRILMAIAVVLFVLAGFNVDIGDFGYADMLACGLAFFAAGHVF